MVDPGTAANNDTSNVYLAADDETTNAFSVETTLTTIGTNVDPSGVTTQEVSTFTLVMTSTQTE
jgi:hypothetical protein